MIKEGIYQIQANEKGSTLGIDVDNTSIIIQLDGDLLQIGVYSIHRINHIAYLTLHLNNFPEEE